MATRVLICDADVPLLWSYSDHLCERGFEVGTATDGLACVAKLRQFRPDVLVLEPRVLWGRGEGVIAMMREEPDIPMAAVIVVTSDPDARSLRTLQGVPIKACYIKPLAPDRLEQSIREIVEQRTDSNDDPQPFTEPRSVDLNVEVEHRIDQRTGGRIHGLHVDTAEDRMIVHGHTGTYYARQLALAAAMEALESLGSADSKTIELDVAVLAK